MSVPINQFELKADYSQSLSSLEDGHTYIVREETYKPKAYNPPDNRVLGSDNMDAANAEWTTSVSASSYKGYDKISENTYTFTYWKDTSTFPTITFTNHHNILKHNLTVEKHVTTQNSNKTEDKDFEFTLKFTNITLNMKTQSITYEKSDGSKGSVSLDSENKYSFTLKKEESIKFIGIPDVTDYVVTEKPYGNYHSKNVNAKGQILGGDQTAVFTNDKVDIIELPRSGGFGNTLPYMLLFGITCMLFGTAYYAGKKKKSE